MKEGHLQEMAMFRFGLIAPVINNTYSEPSKLAYYRNAVSRPLELPDGSKATYSASTLSYWENVYRKEGFDALITKGRSDKGSSRKLTQEAMDAIMALKRQYPRINATMIRERLIETGVIDAKDVSLSTVQRFVRQRREVIAEEQGRKDRKAFEAERVCELWQSDTMYGPYVAHNGRKVRTYLISAIDDKSRLVSASRFFLSDNALNFQQVLKAGILRFGIPEKLYADNGSPYRSDQLSAICGRIGCVLLHAPVRDGAAKGKIERWHKTLRQRYLSVIDPCVLESLEALNTDFVSWLAKYNTTVHSATDRTPMDRYMEGSKDVRRPRSAEWLDDAFLNTETRRVRKDATVSLDNVSYDVPMSFINTKVTIRFLPGDVSSVHVLHEGRGYPIHPTDKVANSKAVREKTRYRVPYLQEGGDNDASCPIPA